MSISFCSQTQGDAAFRTTLLCAANVSLYPSLYPWSSLLLLIVPDSNCSRYERLSYCVLISFGCHSLVDIGLNGTFFRLRLCTTCLSAAGKAWRMENNASHSQVPSISTTHSESWDAEIPRQFQLGSSSITTAMCWSTEVIRFISLHATGYLSNNTSWYIIELCFLQSTSLLHIPSKWLISMD